MGISGRDMSPLPLPHLPYAPDVDAMTLRISAFTAE